MSFLPLIDQDTSSICVLDEERRCTKDLIKAALIPQECPDNPIHPHYSCHLKEDPMLKRSLFVALILMLAFVSTVLAEENISRENPENYVPGEILVGFKPEATPDQIDAAVASIPISFSVARSGGFHQQALVTVC